MWNLKVHYSAHNSRH